MIFKIKVLFDKASNLNQFSSPNPFYKYPSVLPNIISLEILETYSNNDFPLVKQKYSLVDSVLIGRVTYIGTESVFIEKEYNDYNIYIVNCAGSMNFTYEGKSVDVIIGMVTSTHRNSILESYDL